MFHTDGDMLAARMCTSCLWDRVVTKSGRGRSVRARKRAGRGRTRTVMERPSESTMRARSYLFGEVHAGEVSISDHCGHQRWP